MKANVVTIENKPAGDLDLNKSVFGQELRKDILHRVVNWQLAKRQAGTHKTKVISEIRGTTAKPFRQKGTGNARQGSKYATQMRGGATVFGPVVRSHAHALPKKIRKLGLKVALSAKLADKKLFIVKDLDIKSPKTSVFTENLCSLGVDSVLVIDAQLAENLSKAVANVKHVDVLPVAGANVYDILRRDNLILTESAVKLLEERLA